MAKNNGYAVVVGLLLSLSVFAQGMYTEGGRFNTIIFSFFIATSVLFTICLFKGNISLKPTSLMDWFVISAVLVYIISSFTAVSLWDALFCLSRYVCCFMLYFTVKSVMDKNINMFYRIMFYVGAIISVCGLYTFVEGSGLDYKKGLMISVFKYHNTTAIFSAALLIMGLYLATKVKFGEKIVISGCNTLLLSTIVYAQSRGTWLISALAIILYLIFIYKKQCFSVVVAMLVSSVIAVVATMSGVLNSFATANNMYFCATPGVCVLFLVLALFISCVAMVIFSKIGEQKIFSPKNMLYLIPAVLLVLIVFFVFFAPSAIIERIQNFSFGSSTFSERSMFMKDAFAIFKSKPVLGIGGDGWKYVYPSVQSQYYTVAHPHSYFAEMMTDSGILGILLYALMIVAFVISLFKNKSEEKVPAKLIAFMLVFHSFLDFDTDYMTILSLLFVIFGIITSGGYKAKASKYFVIIPLIMVIWSATNIVALISYNSATKAASTGMSSPFQIYSLSKRATSFMPLNSDYLTVHGNVCRMLAKSDEAYIKEAVEVLEKANSFNRYHYETINQLAFSYFEDGDYEKSCDTIKQLVYYQPFIQKSYDYITNVFNAVNQLTVNSGDLKYADYAVDMLMEAYEYGHSVSSRCRSRIEMGTPMHEAYSKCLDYKESRKAQ